MNVVCIWAEFLYPPGKSDINDLAKIQLTSYVRPNYTHQISHQRYPKIDADTSDTHQSLENPLLHDHIIWSKSLLLWWFVESKSLTRHFCVLQGLSPTYHHGYGGAISWDSWEKILPQCQKIHQSSLCFSVFCNNPLLKSRRQGRMEGRGTCPRKDLAMGVGIFLCVCACVTVCFVCVCIFLDWTVYLWVWVWLRVSVSVCLGRWVCLCEFVWLSLWLSLDVRVFFCE